MTETVVVPMNYIEVREMRDNNDGTVYVKIATDTDYRVSRWKWLEDENNTGTFIHSIALQA